MAIYSEFSLLKMVIFHSYASLPEGIRCFHNTRDRSVSQFDLFFQMGKPVGYSWTHQQMHFLLQGSPKQSTKMKTL